MINEAGCKSFLQALSELKKDDFRDKSKTTIEIEVADIKIKISWLNKD